MDSRLVVNTKKKHIATEDELVFDTWDEMKSYKENDENGNETIHNFTKGRTYSKYISETLRLKKTMNVNDSTVTFSDNFWKKHEDYENFYMTNVRSSRNKFMQQKKTAKPIWLREDLLLEKCEGLSEAFKVRINVFYEKDETDPEKYKFMVRRWKKTTEEKDNNTSMYNK